MQVSWNYPPTDPHVQGSPSDSLVCPKMRLTGWLSRRLKRRHPAVVHTRSTFQASERRAYGRVMARCFRPSKSLDDHAGQGEWQDTGDIRNNLERPVDVGHLFSRHVRRSDVWNLPTRESGRRSCSIRSQKFFHRPKDYGWLAWYRMQ